MRDRPTAADALARSRRPHLVGVAGTGMRSLATLLVDLGHDVSGSDLAAGPALDALAARGVRVFAGHRAEQIKGADLVICSAAVPEENPELVAARERGLPVLTHAQALGALMDQRVGIGVAGTHGKSTTTALIAHLLTVAGRDPTLVGGADAIDFGGSARLGHGPELVAEADEFGRRFLELRPRFAVITGIEPDHLDYYGTFDAILHAFRQFVDGMPADGVVVTCEDEPNLAALELPRRRLRYGWRGHCDWRLERFEPRLGGGAAFTVRDPAGRRGRYEMGLTGRHNAANAVAALAIVQELGVAEQAAREGLASFQGTRRRFETVAKKDGVWVVEDYAHHPTAVAATLEAAREVHDGRIVVLFQPHTSHRTASLLEDFARAFDTADRVILAPIYQPAGRESSPESVTSGDLLDRMYHAAADVVSSLGEALAALREELAPGTLVLTIGAGDVTSVARELISALTDSDEIDAGELTGVAPAGSSA